MNLFFVFDHIHVLFGFGVSFEFKVGVNLILKLIEEQAKCIQLTMIKYCSYGLG